MKTIIACIALFFMMFSSIKAQDIKDSLQVKPNPIIFASMNLGFLNGDLKGLSTSFDVNYQQKNNLFTFKYTAIIDIEEIGFIFFIPFTKVNSETEQFAILYGKRYVEDGFSYHFSGGISYNTTNDRILDEHYNYVGFPLEIGLNWFKSNKEKFRVMYGLIPVGKPTSFGRSIGIKFYGNIGKKSYAGMGLNIGIGWHKKYD